MFQKIREKVRGRGWLGKPQPDFVDPGLAGAQRGLRNERKVKDRVRGRVQLGLQKPDPVAVATDRCIAMLRSKCSTKRVAGRVAWIRPSRPNTDFGRMGGSMLPILGRCKQRRVTNVRQDKQKYLWTYATGSTFVPPPVTVHWTASQTIGGRNFKEPIGSFKRRPMGSTRRIRVG